MARERVLFVAEPATAAVVAGFESTARNRGHSAMSVLDPRHAPQIARAFRPSVVARLAPAGFEPMALSLFCADSVICHFPVVVLSPAVDYQDVVDLFVAGAAAVEQMEGGMRALDRALETMTAYKGWSRAGRALAELLRRGATGGLRVRDASDSWALMKDGALIEVQCNGGRGEQALERLRAMTEAVSLRFEGPDDSMEIDVVEAAAAARDAGGTETLSAVAPPDARPLFGVPKVLVVEDDEDLLRMFAANLTHDGYFVIGAGDGLTGFDAALAERPDVIVTDIKMPRADGWELLGRVRDDARVREIPIVMISNFTDMLQKLRGMRVGADAYVEKGGPKAELLNAVRALVDRRRDARATAASGALPVSGRLEDIGAATLLSALELGERSGVLVVGSGWGSVRVVHHEGRIVSARAELDDVALDGREALLLLLDLGETAWSFEHRLAESSGVRFSQMQDALAAALHARKIAASIAAATRRGLTVVEERALFYAGTADNARAVVDRMASAPELDDETRATFRDLLRRGVART